MGKKIFTFLIIAIKFFAILGVFTFLGFYIPLLYGTALDNGRFVKWQKLAQPPEQVEKLLAPNYVLSSSGIIYKYSPIRFLPPGPCGIDCWDKVDALAKNDSGMLPLSDCGWLPNVETYSDYVATCEKFGPGGTLTRILARDQSGSLYTWTNGKGEGNIHIIVYDMILGIMIGFVVGLTLATIIVRADIRRKTQTQT